jgi:DNA-binding NarL/FixJ family response regulator
VIRVLLADDQAIVRGGLRMILDVQPDIEVVGEAETGVRAVELVRETAPDVVLMDIRMPDLDGISATRQLLAGPGPAPNVLILTTFDLDEYLYEALRAGASGFLLKTAEPQELIAGVHAVASGDALVAPEITRRLLEEFARRPPPGTLVPERLSGLTERELDVLRLVARGKSNTEIAADLFLSPGTVKAHVGHLLAKLDARDRTQAVVIAYESGLVRPGEPDHPSGAS